MDATVVDGNAVRSDATLGGEPVAPTYVTPEQFPATVEEFIAYFDGLATADGTMSLTLDQHGWYPAEGRVDPLPDAEDDEFSWTLSIELS